MPSNNNSELNGTYKLTSLGDTEQIASKIAPELKPLDVLLLDGSLGSGKTTFVSYLIPKLTNKPEEVKSPTFPVVQSYTANIGDIYHFDLYRLEDPEELFELGFEEALEGITIIEWPAIAKEFIPRSHIALYFQFNDNQYISLEIKDNRKI